MKVFKKEFHRTKLNTMKISIKKQPSYLSIRYTNGEYSNNLYCSNLNLLKALAIKTLEFDFEGVKKGKILSNSKDDLEYLNDNILQLDLIQFNDATVFKKLSKSIGQNESVKIVIKCNKPIELISKIEFNAGNEVTIKIGNNH
jgi:hypothetical protein